MASLGVLKFELVEAAFTKRTDLIRKMDPYVKVKCREFEWKSETCKGGGKKPEWSDQCFEIDVKYMGDDLYYQAYDQDPGKDEHIGDGASKLSAFCVQPEWDEWFEIEHKGKRHGKLHFKVTWEPANSQEQAQEVHGDEMGQLQEMIRDLAMKKKELTTQYNDIKDRMDEHDEEAENKRNAIKEEHGAHPEKWEAMQKEIEDKCAADHEAADAMKADLDDKKAALEEDLQKQLVLAVEVRDAAVARLDAAETKAATDKDEALAAAEAAKVACEEDNKKKQEELDERIAKQQRADENAEEAIKDEIKETAEKLLKINEMIQERLQKLTEL